MGKIKWIQSCFDIIRKQKEDFEICQEHKKNKNHYLSEAGRRKWEEKLNHCE